MSINSRWYVVHTYSGYEKKVAGNIEKVAENRNMQDQILGVLIPVMKEEEKETQNKKSEQKNENEQGKPVKENKPKEHLKFPGYVLVKMAVTMDDNDLPVISDEAWFVVRNTRGVTGFVGPESKPTPLTEEEVYRLGVEKRIVEVNYEVGDTVNICDGIFEGNTGRVEKIDTDNNIVEITLAGFFGKETKVELDLDQVEPITY